MESNKFKKSHTLGSKISHVGLEENSRRYFLSAEP